MKLLTPDHVFRDITCITLDFLRQNGIEGLVLDVDNTLTAHGSQELRADIAQWVNDMRAAGVLLMIASNNTKKRVSPFARRLGLPFVSFSLKPSPKWLLAARRLWRLPKSRMALVGDQFFTDVLAGNLTGVRVLLVRPIAVDTKATIVLKRKLEAPLLMRYYRRGGTLIK